MILFFFGVSGHREREREHHLFKSWNGSHSCARLQKMLHSTSKPVEAIGYHRLQHLIMLQRIPTGFNYFSFQKLFQKFFQATTENGRRGERVPTGASGSSRTVKTRHRCWTIGDDDPVAPEDAESESRWVKMMKIYEGDQLSVILIAKS